MGQEVGLACAPIGQSARLRAGVLTEWPGVGFACAADCNQRGAPAISNLGEVSRLFSRENCGKERHKHGSRRHLIGLRRGATFDGSGTDQRQLSTGHL